MSNLGKMIDQEIDSIMMSYGKTSPGQLTYKEACSFFKELFVANGEPDCTEEMTEYLFRLLDHKKKGNICADDLKDVILTSPEYFREELSMNVTRYQGNRPA